ncbi:MAG: flagellar M-ring protein FliF [Thermotogota bacterium]|nr:flagellar M-ring protein FliF [Thermotogota bacterium]MDK2864214.1 flagellar M-ring protein FliF [Thermotogota bacterium]HCZ05645.1 flagellar M-ring protein FliF [Thermotogota bacterium]
MNFIEGLRSFLKRLTEGWKRLPTTGKLTVIAVALAGVILLVVLGVEVARTNYVVLVKNLSEDEAGRIAQALENMGINYKAGPGGSILIPDTANVYEVRMKLAAEGVLGTATRGFEILDQQSFGATAFDKQVNFQRALQGELERSIATIDGVRFARVFLTLPKFTYYTRDGTKPSASVLVYLEPGAELDSKQVKGIMELVAGAVEGLDVKDVRVIDNRSRILSDSVVLDLQNLEATTKFELKRQVQQYYTNLITQKLEQIFGPGNVVVMSEIELDWQKIERESKKYEPVTKNEGIVISKEEEKETAKGVSPGGDVGTEGNIPPTTYPSITTGSESSERTRSVVNYNVNEIYEKIVSDKYGEISSKSFTVVVDASAISPISTSSTLEEELKNALALATNSPPTSIALVFIPFNRQLAAEIEAEMKKAQQAEARRRLILGYSLLVVVAVLAIFLISHQLRRARARKLVEERRRQLEKELREKFEEEVKELAPEEEEFAQFIKELIELSNKDPESVADVIRMWLSE